MDEIAEAQHSFKLVESDESEVSKPMLPRIFFHPPREDDSLICLEPEMHNQIVLDELLDEQWRESRAYLVPVLLILLAAFYVDGWFVGPGWHFPTLFFTTLAVTIAIMAVLGLFYWVFWIKLASAFRPNRISMLDTGFEHYRQHKRWRTNGKFIYWSQVARVFVLNEEDYDRIGSIAFELYPEDSELPPDRFCLPLAAFGPKNFDKLFSGLKRHLPAEKIDESLLTQWESLHPKIESNVSGGISGEQNLLSYTTLWLGVLQNSKPRVKTSALEPGSKLQGGIYEIVSRIGMGGQATVYLATAADDFSLRHRVALKEFILPVHAGQDAVRRFALQVEREVTLLARLENEHIVRLVDSFVEDWRIYLVQQYLEGDSLQNIVEKKGSFSEDETIELALQMCNALNYLHNLAPPIVHRDFTPHNLMLCSDGKVRLIDFNVAFQPEFNTGKTIVGKRNYIPPEQFRGQASIESDIYALGGTLLFLLTGRDPEPLSQSFPVKVLPEISEGLNQIVARATALAIEERYRSVEELSGDLKKRAESPGKSRLKKRAEGPGKILGEGPGKIPA
jgi:hypothetical protein